MALLKYRRSRKQIRGWAGCAGVGVYFSLRIQEPARNLSTCVGWNPQGVGRPANVVEPFQLPNERDIPLFQNLPQQGLLRRNSAGPVLDTSAGKIGQHVGIVFEARAQPTFGNKTAPGVERPKQV